MNEGTKGQRLRKAIRAAMRERAETVTQVAKQVGVSQSYLSQLLNGDKLMESVSDHHLRGFAAYLGMPPIAGFLLAERLELTDFFEDTSDLEHRLEAGLASVCASPPAAEAGVGLADLGGLSVAVRLLIVLLHQRAQGEYLLRPINAWWSTRRILLQD